MSPLGLQLFAALELHQSEIYLANTLKGFFLHELVQSSSLQVLPYMHEERVMPYVNYGQYTVKMPIKY